MARNEISGHTRLYAVIGDPVSHSLSPRILNSAFAATGVDAVPIRFAGSYQRDDTGETVAVEVVMRGRQKEIDTGEGKQGEDTESKISVVCTYFRLTMDGKELVEIDTINMIEKVNGVDRLEQHRRNIGL